MGDASGCRDADQFPVPELEPNRVRALRQGGMDVAAEPLADMGSEATNGRRRRRVVVVDPHMAAGFFSGGVLQNTEGAMVVGAGDRDIPLAASGNSKHL